MILSDSAFFPDCLANCHKTCHANNLTDVSIVPLTWGLVTPSLLQLPAVDIILGSDCFYDTKGETAKFSAIVTSTGLLSPQLCTQNAR